MTGISTGTRHTIVSQYARGRRAQAIADLTGLPVAVVTKIGQEHGAPDMGRLANEAERLRKALDQGAKVRSEVEGKPVGGGLTAAAGLDLLLAEAERIESPRLASRAKDLMARLDQLRTDLSAASKAHAEKAAKAEKRARLAELQAEAAKIRAELGQAPRPREKGTHSKVANDPTVPAIRAWAAANGVECPRYGRIPASVRTAYEESLPQKAKAS